MKSNTLIIDAFWTDNKPFPSELEPNSADGKIFYNSFPDNSRHLGWMDLVLLRNIIKERNISHITLNNLDTLGKIAEITHKVDVCIAYTYKKYFIIACAEKDTNFKKCQPRYKTIIFGGWTFSENDSQIPERAKRYMSYLLVQTHVESVTCKTNKVKITAHFDQEKKVIFETEVL